MATKKAGGTASNLKDSPGQRLGIKLYAGEFAQAGSIIVRQRGTKVHPGKNVARGKDDTLYAKVAGIVGFRALKRKKFNGSLARTVYADVTSDKK